MQKTLILIALIISLPGCATLVPERHAANILIGKNINESVKYFGRPYSNFIDETDGPHHGEAVYVFIKNPGSYTEDKLVGSDFDNYNGALVKNNYFEKIQRLSGCVISLWANNKNIVTYYEIKGDCGIGGIGLGTTGNLHKYGVD